MANKWLVALKAKNTPHNTPTTLREADDGDTPAGGEIGQTPEKPLAKTAKITSSDKVDTPTPSKNGSDPQKPLAKTAKIPERPKKRTPRKKKLTSEEEEKHRSQLARTFPAYVYTEERAKEVLEWVRQVPEVALDIETYGRLKRDGRLYTAAGSASCCSTTTVRPSSWTATTSRTT